jgi:hypothetical protein
MYKARKTVSVNRFSKKEEDHWWFDLFFVSAERKSLVLFNILK